MKSELIKMNGAEMALYKSGVRRGHAECLKQISGQLTEAAIAQRNGREHAYDLDAVTGEISGVLPVEEGVAVALINFSEQLKTPAAQADKEQQELLVKFCDLRAKSRGVVERARDAVSGAIGGWRGR